MKKAQLITAACAALMWTAAAGVPTVAAQTPGSAGGPPAGGQAGSSSGATSRPPDMAGQDDMSNRTSAKSESSDLQRFVEKASIVNMAEIQLGQLAAERAQDPQVKQFAQTMVDDHTKAQEQLKTVASNQNIPIPSALDGKHQKLHDKLAKLQGAEFDRAYIDAMVDGHKDAEKLLKKRAEEKNKATASNTSHTPATSGSGAAVGTSGANAPSSSGAAGTSGTMRENESASASERDANRATTSSASVASESAAGAPASPDEWAAMTLPKVREHLEHARALEDQVKQAGRANDRGPDANSPQAPSPGGPNPPSPSGSGSNPPRTTPPQQ